MRLAGELVVNVSPLTVKVRRGSGRVVNMRGRDASLRMRINDNYMRPIDNNRKTVSTS